jgi:hypothetical protein
MVQFECQSQSSLGELQWKSVKQSVNIGYVYQLTLESTQGSLDCSASTGDSWQQRPDSSEMD